MTVIPEKNVCNEGMDGSPHESLVILVIGRNCIINKNELIEMYLYYMYFRHARRDCIVSPLLVTLLRISRTTSSDADLHTC